MNEKTQTYSNTTGAIGTRKVEEGLDVGPIYVATVPNDYSQKEMENIRDLLLFAPDEYIGCVIVLQGSVNLHRIND